MERKRRIGMVMAGALVAAGLGAGLTLAGAGGGTPRTVKAGAVIADGRTDSRADHGQPTTPPDRVDITGVSAEYRPEGLALTVAVQEPVDPFADGNWAGDGTFLSWELDTTGDGLEDYEVSYHVEDGALTGEVTRAAESSSSFVCNLSAATFTPAGYTAMVEPTCLENPTRIAYRVTYYYQTDPSNDDAPVIVDTAPDQGMTPSLIAPAQAASPATGGK